MTKQSRYQWIAVGIILLGIILDILTKQLVIAHMAIGDTIPLWEDVLHLTHTVNYGAAFNIFEGKPYIFNTISILAIVGMSLYIFCFKVQRPLWYVSFSMIISGGIGNMIDRLTLGYVTDFIDFRIINFAVFNFADILVTCGSALLIFDLISELREEYQREMQSRALAAKEAEGAPAAQAEASTAQDGKTDTTPATESTIETVPEDAEAETETETASEDADTKDGTDR